MDQLAPKKVSESRTEQTQIIMPEHINGDNRLFGGRLAEWIDVVAAAVARRHSNRNVTTVTIDHLEFKEPAYMNDMVVLIGRITYVGRTSMEVRVDTFLESFSGSKLLMNRAYLLLVALDENDRPTQVPRLILETDEEREEWEAGIKRNALRKERSIEN